MSTDPAAVRELAAQVKSPTDIEFDEEHRIVVAPPQWAVHDVSKYLPPPDRIIQRVEMLNLESFLDYVQKYELTGAVFANEGIGRYEAVLDYHTADGDRGYQDHVALYTCPQSEQWQTWMAQNGKKLGQIDFARFLEDNLPDIVTPPAAQMLEMVLNIHAHKTASFVSEQRLQDGQVKVRYDETITGGSLTRGEIILPDSFTLGIPVFVDGTVFEVKCRLRFRIDNGNMVMWYEIERPTEIFRNAVKVVSVLVRETLKGVHFWAGKRG